MRELTWQGPGFDLAVSGMQFQQVEPSRGRDVAVPCARPQSSFHGIQVLMSVAAFQPHIALEIADLNVAVAGPQTHLPFPWHVDLNLHPGVAAIEVEKDERHMRVMHLDRNRVTGLVLLNPNAAVADLVVIGCHSGLDRVSVPGHDADIGIAGVDSQIGFPCDRVALGPFIGMRERRARQA